MLLASLPLLLTVLQYKTPASSIWYKLASLPLHSQILWITNLQDHTLMLFVSGNVSVYAKRPIARLSRTAQSLMLDLHAQECTLGHQTATKSIYVLIIWPVFASW